MSCYSTIFHTTSCCLVNGCGFIAFGGSSSCCKPSKPSHTHILDMLTLPPLYTYIIAAVWWGAPGEASMVETQTCPFSETLCNHCASALVALAESWGEFWDIPSIFVFMQLPTSHGANLLQPHRSIVTSESYCYGCVWVEHYVALHNKLLFS